MSPDAAAPSVETAAPAATGARIVPFKRWHMGRLEGRGHEVLSWGALGGIDRAAELCDQSDYAYTALAGGRPVACIGVTTMWRGVGAAWAFLGQDAPRYWKTIHGGVIMFLRGAMCDGEFHRIQTAVRLDHAAGHRWAMRLGFRPEGVLRGYGPDLADFMAYARCQ